MGQDSKFRINWGKVWRKYQKLTLCYFKTQSRIFPSQVQKWAKKNVLVNTVRVGVTDTKIHSKLKSKNMKKRISLVPLKRMADKKEIANFVFFLGSDRNSYISNQVMRISGGE